MVEGKEDNILLRHSSGGSRSFWVPKSRVASSLETAKGRIIAGDRDHLQKQIGILSRENSKLSSSEAAESERADELEATLETTRLSHHSEVLMGVYCEIHIIVGFKDPTPSRQMFQVDKFQRSAKAIAKEHESALANSTAKLRVTEAAIGRAYIAGGGVDAELQHALAANKELESRVTELVLQVSIFLIFLLLL